MRSTDLLSIGEIAARSGLAPSAVRYYQACGLITAQRSTGNQRRYERSTLRRLAVIRAARSVGLGLEEIKASLAALPGGRVPTAADWARLSRGWRDRLDEQIEAMQALRDGLQSCIGCGCLSLGRCRLSNRDDVVGTAGESGAAYLPAALRRAPAEGRQTSSH